MCGGLRCNRLVPKEGPKQVSDGSGKRGEEEKVFTEGRPDHKKVDWSSTSRSGVQEVVDEPCSGLGRAVR